MAKNVCYLAAKVLPLWVKGKHEPDRLQLREEVLVARSQKQWAKAPLQPQSRIDFINGGHDWVEAGLGYRCRVCLKSVASPAAKTQASLHRCPGTSPLCKVLENRQGHNLFWAKPISDCTLDLLICKQCDRYCSSIPKRLLQPCRPPPVVQNWHRV